MTKRIVLLDGHPDASDARFVHALATAYASAAIQTGHEVRALKLADMAFPWLRSSEEFHHGETTGVIRKSQDDIQWCTHLVVFYPLWLGAMPALLKAFLEQLLRPGFAFAVADGQRFPRKLLKGKSARIVVTMGMPGFVYRWYFRAHSLKNLKRNILAFAGFGPIRASVVGSVESISAEQRNAWLERMRQLGRTGT